MWPPISSISDASVVVVSRPLTTESGSSAGSAALPATPPSVAHYLDVPISSMSLSPSLPHTPGSTSSSAPYTPLNTPVTFTFAPGILGPLEPRTVDFSYSPNPGPEITLPADCQNAYELSQSTSPFGLFQHPSPSHSRHNSDGSSCSCVGNPAVYSALAEAAGQLRRAAELLGTEHTCEVRQRVADMDAYLTYVFPASPNKHA